jgi:outer membrane protein assembly factor BamB
LVTLIAGSTLAQGLGGQLISEATAVQYGLHRAWATRVQVDGSTGRIGSVALHGKVMVVQTDQSIIQALDAETGQTLWVTSVGKSSLPTTSAALNDKYVAVANGSKLYLLGIESGEPIWEKKLEGAPSAGPAMNSTRVYIPMLSGGIESYKLERKGLLDGEPTRYFGKGASEVPPVASDERLMWATTAGYVVADDLDVSRDRIRFKTGGPVSAPVAYWPPLLFAGSRDGYAYALRMTSGDQVWRFYAGGSIRHKPVAIKDAVYIVADSGGMSRLDAATGVEQWWAADITKFLAASPSRIYAADAVGRLLILDARSGSRLASLPTEAMTFKFTNITNDRLYLGTSTGLIQCVHEVGLASPDMHAAPLKAEKPKPPMKPAEPTEPAAESAQ